MANVIWPVLLCAAEKCLLTTLAGTECLQLLPQSLALNYLCSSSPLTLIFLAFDLWMASCEKPFSSYRFPRLTYNFSIYENVHPFSGWVDSVGSENTLGHVTEFILDVSARQGHRTGLHLELRKFRDNLQWLLTMDGTHWSSLCLFRVPCWFVPLPLGLSSYFGHHGPRPTEAVHTLLGSDKWRK